MTALNETLHNDPKTHQTSENLMKNYSA